MNRKLKITEIKKIIKIKNKLLKIVKIKKLYLLLYF